MKTRKLATAMAAIMMVSACTAGCSNTEKKPETTPSATEAAKETSKTTETSTTAASTVEPEFILRYGDVNPDGHVIVNAAHYFADTVNELSGGRIAIEIYPSGQLGDDAQCYQAMQMGALDLYRGNSSSLTDFGNPQIAALALPYIFRDREHFWNVCSSELGDRILANMQESGSQMVGIAFLDEGARNFFTTTKPITKLEDIKNQKIRVQSSELMLDTVSALGASPTPIAYAELYTSLQSGVVDGAENPPASYFSNKFYEVAPNYVKDGHTYAPSVILMSEITWNKLGEELQNVIMEAAKKTQEYNKIEIEKADEDAYQAMKDAGVNVLELEDTEAWSAAMAPVYEKHGAKFIDLIDEIKAVK